MRASRLLCTVVFASGCLLACGGHDAPPETPPPPPADAPAALDAPDANAPAPSTNADADASAASGIPTVTPARLAKDTLLGDGNTFMFSLDDSPDALKLVQAACAKSQKKEKKRAACVRKAKTEAASEGLRIEKLGADRWAWVLFGTEKGRTVVNQRFAFTVQSDDATKVVVAPQGKDEGKRPLKSLPKAIEVEAPDDQTVVMNDARKGRLVFKKKTSGGGQ